MYRGSRLAASFLLVLTGLMANRPDGTDVEATGEDGSDEALAGPRDGDWFGYGWEHSSF